MDIKVKSRSCGNINNKQPCVSAHHFYWNPIHQWQLCNKSWKWLEIREDSYFTSRNQSSLHWMYCYIQSMVCARRDLIFSSLFLSSCTELLKLNSQSQFSQVLTVIYQVALVTRKQTLSRTPTNVDDQPVQDSTDRKPIIKGFWAQIHL